MIEDALEIGNFEQDVISHVVGRYLQAAEALMMPFTDEQ